ncbi:hypothetical protein K503DRAFT_778092 [Rhizopogon vinicolor AM-OR11-026]|uniref:Uncharacterized protein n=1 Tax=Rhizopogon vinicolor AM-OR11-026 TaxID=1314800 RepID=A0A1B7MDH8_9AGAM|nr:hypothetical protein K503DRAFT_778092 [Rhizopogon vinicolor AM-OR11-026]
MLAPQPLIALAQKSATISLPRTEIKILYYHLLWMQILLRPQNQPQEAQLRVILLYSHTNGRILLGLLIF